MELKDFKLSANNLGPMIDNLNHQEEEIFKAIDEKNSENERRHYEEVEREKKIIELLESIEKNTFLLVEIFKILETNTTDQKIILEIVNELNSLFTINQKEETKTLYRKIMDKINNLISDVNTSNTLISYALFVSRILIKNGKL